LAAFGACTAGMNVVPSSPIQRLSLIGMDGVYTLSGRMCRMNGSSQLFAVDGAAGTPELALAARAAGDRCLRSPVLGTTQIRKAWLTDVPNRYRAGVHDLHGHHHEEHRVQNLDRLVLNFCWPW
jgi:hypothetical protein